MRWAHDQPSDHDAAESAFKWFKNLADTDAEVLIQDENFSARDAPPIHIDVHWVTRRFVEFDNRVGVQPKDIFDKHLCPAKLDAHTQIHIREHADGGGRFGRARSSKVWQWNGGTRRNCD